MPTMPRVAFERQISVRLVCELIKDWLSRISWARERERELLHIIPAVKHIAQGAVYKRARWKSSRCKESRIKSEVRAVEKLCKNAVFLAKKKGGGANH